MDSSPHYRFQFMKDEETKKKVNQQSAPPLAPKRRKKREIMGKKMKQVKIIE